MAQAALSKPCRWMCLQWRDVSALEREIDQQVYTLYGLTPEEIKLVEEAAKG